MSENKQMEFFPDPNLQLTPLQVKKITGMPVGAGFLLYHVEDGRCQVGPFFMNTETGEFLDPAGDPLTFKLDNGERVEYQIVVKRNRNKRSSYERRSHVGVVKNAKKRN